MHYRDIDAKYNHEEIVVTQEDRARVVLWNIGTVLRDIAEAGTGQGPSIPVTVADLTQLAENLGALLYTKTTSGTFGRAFPRGPEYAELWDRLLLGGRDVIAKLGKQYPFEA